MKIRDIVVEPLKQISDDRGKVMHMLRADSPLYKKFGEIYFSVVNHNAVKAWKRHLKMTQLFAVPVGSIRLVIYDERAGSPSRGEIEAFETGEDNYCLIKIPPLLWYGFKGISSIPALIANCADMPHDPYEIERINYADKRIPYEWD